MQLKLVLTPFPSPPYDTTSRYVGCVVCWMLPYPALRRFFSPHQPSSVHCSTCRVCGPRAAGALLPYRRCRKIRGSRATRCTPRPLQRASGPWPHQSAVTTSGSLRNNSRCTQRCLGPGQSVKVAAKCWFTFLTILPTNEHSSTNGSVTDWMGPWQHPCWIHTALSLRSFFTVTSSENKGKLHTLWERHSGVNVTGIQAHFVLPLHLMKACVTVILVVWSWRTGRTNWHAWQQLSLLYENGSIIMKIQEVWTDSRVLLSHRIYWRTNQGNRARNVCQKSWIHLRFQIVVRSIFLLFFATELPCKMSLSQVRRSHVRPTRVADRSRLTLNTETGSCSCKASEHVRQWYVHTHSNIRSSLTTEKDISSSEAEVLQGKTDRFLQTNQAITFCTWVHPRSAGRAGRSACGGSKWCYMEYFWMIWWEDKHHVVSQHYWSVFSTYTQIFCCELPEIHDRINHFPICMARLPLGWMNNTISNHLTNQDNYSLAIRKWLWRYFR